MTSETFLVKDATIPLSEQSVGEDGESMFVWLWQRLSALEVTIDKVVMLQMVARTPCLTLI
jgi:hypothetical protein